MEQGITSENNDNHKKPTSDESAETLIPEEFLNTLPKGERESIKSILSVRGAFPQQNPILSKITSEHITELLKNSDEEDKRDREERKSERGHNYKIMVTALIALILISSILLYFKQTEILKYFSGSVLGFGGGFGVGKYYRKEEE